MSSVCAVTADSDVTEWKGFGEVENCNVSFSSLRRSTDLVQSSNV